MLIVLRCKVKFYVLEKDCAHAMTRLNDGGKTETRWCSEWLARWTSDLKVGGSRASPCHLVVFLEKNIYPTLSLFTQVYKMK